jgi:DNA-binding SARP family transcriptional activator
MTSTADVADVASVRFALFGGVRAWRGEVEVPLGPPRQRALLQLLLVASGEPVSLGEILTALWVDEPAASATNQVHRHVGELRRRFEPELGRREVGRWLLPTGSGYRLVVDATSLDLLRFRDLLREGENLAETSPESATAVMAQALEVARAAPGDDPLRGMPRFVAVEDERVRAAIRAAEIALCAGRAGDVLPSLREIAGAHRFDELLQARLMDCLTGSGRSAEALALFEQIRTRLRDDLGVDPGAALAQAQARALAGPAADTAAPVGSAAATPPAQLPAPPPWFAGRHGLLAALHDKPGGRHRTLLITGMAGVGKTTLALHHAAELAHDYPDGQLYVNLRGFDATAAPTDPLDALRDMLEGLGVPSQRQPESVDGRSGLLRSILSQKRVLLVLDNAHDYRQVEPLLPGAGASRVIVTSRNGMPGLAAFNHARPIQLQPFNDEEIVEFFSRRLATGKVLDDRAAVIRLGRACGGLPLALAIVTARAAANPDFPLDLLVREFTQERTPLASLNAGSAELDLGTAFSWSYRGLSEDAARTFALLSAHPGPEISTAAAVSMSALDPRRAREVLTELTLASVLREVRPGRFVFHDLVREYALSLLAEDEVDASARLVNHYVRSTCKAILTFGQPSVAPVDETVPGILRLQPRRNPLVHRGTTRPASGVPPRRQRGRLPLGAHAHAGLEADEPGRRRAPRHASLCRTRHRNRRARRRARAACRVLPRRRVQLRTNRPTRTRPNVLRPGRRGLRTVRRPRWPGERLSEHGCDPGDRSPRPGRAASRIGCHRPPARRPTDPGNLAALAGRGAALGREVRGRPSCIRRVHRDHRDRSRPRLPRAARALRPVEGPRRCRSPGGVGRRSGASPRAPPARR